MSLLKSVFSGSLPADDGISVLGEQYTATRAKIIQTIDNGGLHAHKRIAGIPCPDELTTGKMLDFFKQEDLRIMQIKNMLEKAGLPFRAIVRTDFYNQVKKQKGVYSFRNINTDGFTSISESDTQKFITEKVSAISEKIEKITAAAQVITALLVAGFCEYWFCAYNWDRTPQEFWITFWTFHIAVMWWAVAIPCTFAASLVNALLKKFVFTPSNLYAKVVKEISKNYLNVFWKDYEDHVRGPQVKVDFITPPAHIAGHILTWKKAGYNVHISAQKEAFSVDITGIQPFLKQTADEALKEVEHKRKLEFEAKMEARRLFWKKFDPIVSAEIDEFTVLIDAYGGQSFVSEVEVVDSVLGYYNTKLKQFQTQLN